MSKFSLSHRPKIDGEQLFTLAPKAECVPATLSEERPLTRSELCAEIPSTFDNTLVTNFAGCPLKFELFLRGFDYPQGARPPYFAFGSAWGEAQRVLYDSPKGLHAALPDAIAEATRVYLEALPDGGPSGDNSLERLLTLINLYCDFYADGDPFSQIGAELGFQYPLPFTVKGTEVFWGGALDSYIEHKQLGVMLKEDKTTAAASDSYLDSYRMSPQVTGYSWVTSQLTAAEAPVPVLVNIVQKKIISYTPRLKKNGEPYANWSPPSHPQFIRIISERTPEDHTRWLQSIEFHLNHIFDCFETQCFPQTLDSSECFGRPGRSRCLFLPICRSGVPLADFDHRAFGDAFSVRCGPWEPWKRNESQTTD